MKKSKVKVGDRVQMKDSYADWLTDYAKDLYTVGGEYDGRHDSDLTPLFASRLYEGCPLIGTVKTLENAGKPPARAYLAFVEFSNFWGKYDCYVNVSRLTKLSNKKAKK